MANNDRHDAATERDPEERLHDVWLETREELGYDYLVDLHWDVCKEIVGRDEEETDAR